MQLPRELFGPFLSKLAQEYDLVDRWYAIRVQVDQQTGQKPQKGVVQIAKLTPFVLLGLAWASNRVYDGGIVSVTLKTSERIFINDPVKLGAAFGSTPDGAPIAMAAPAKIAAGEELTVTLERDFNIDPGEAYPGVNYPSQIDLCFIGCDLLPFGSVVERAKSVKG
jgi:hypothetical protein